MMIDVPAAAIIVPLDEPPALEEVPSRWAALAPDLRFFLLCYLAGLIFFLVMLS